METEPHFTIHQVAEHTGLTEHTLRYYERIGLLDSVGRAQSGHRRYSDADVQRIEFLNRLRATGMPIRQMLEYVQGGPEARGALLEAHRERVLSQMEELQQSLERIEGKIAMYKEVVQEKVKR
jgi:DNA-binding transcriptional MerR regulator